MVRPAGTAYLNYEGEVALVIGRPPASCTLEDALSHVLGYTVANDFGLHDFRHADRGSMLRVKGQDGFCPLGPGIVRADPSTPPGSPGAPTSTAPWCRTGTPRELLFPFAYLIADVARLITLEPGDVLLTGTPAHSRPVEPGDVVEVEVEGVGRLCRTRWWRSRSTGSGRGRSPRTPRRPGTSRWRCPRRRPPGSGQALLGRAELRGSRLPSRPVALLLGAQLTETLGWTALQTALGWQAYGRTHNTLTLGLIGLAEFFPALLLAIPAGHASDRYDRRLVVALSSIAGTAVAIGFAIDAAVGDTQAWPLYLLAAAGGAAQGFASPSFNPLMAAAVPAASLSRVIALSSLTWQSSSVTGPVIGGLLQSVGNAAPYIVAAALTATTAVLVLFVRRDIGVAHVDGELADATFTDALAGVRLIIANPALLGAISLDLAAVLFGGATALLPAFAQDVLHVGSGGYGVLRAAPGIGAVVVGVLLAARPIRRRVGPTLMVAVATFGAAHRGLRHLAHLRRLSSGARRPGRGGHDLGPDPRHAHAAPDPALAARPGVSRGAGVRRRVERARRVRVGRRRRPGRRRARRSSWAGSRRSGSRACGRGGSRRCETSTASRTWCPATPQETLAHS